MVQHREESQQSQSLESLALVGEGRTVAAVAPRLEDAAVDLDDALASGAPMEAVDVLGDEEVAVAEASFDLGEGLVAGIGLQPR